VYCLWSREKLPAWARMCARVVTEVRAQFLWLASPFPVGHFAFYSFTVLSVRFVFCIFGISSYFQSPCGGELEYLHRCPASRKRR
jgi:hypothetical protein